MYTLIKLLCTVSSSELDCGSKLSLKVFTFSDDLLKSSISGSFSELSHKFEISSKFSILYRPFSYSAFNVSSISVSTLLNQR